MVLSRFIRDTYVHAAGFYCDAYNLLAISTASLILTRMYGRAFVQWKPFVDSVSFLGAFVGQMGFGVLADRIGRVKSMAYANYIICVMPIVCALLPPWAPADPNGEDLPAFVFLVLARGLLGIGIGAEYPHTATAIAEKATARARARTVLLVFSLQGAGFLTASLAGAVYTQILCTDPPPHPGRNIDLPMAADDTRWSKHNAAWRIVLGLGALPAILMLPYRVANARAGNDSHFYKTKDRLFRSHLSAKLVLRHYGWRLLGTGGSWFVFDIVFYVSTVYANLATQQLDSASDSDWHDHLSQAAAYNVLFQAAALHFHQPY